MHVAGIDRRGKNNFFLETIGQDAFLLRKTVTHKLNVDRYWKLSCEIRFGGGGVEHLGILMNTSEMVLLHDGSVAKQ